MPGIIRLTLPSDERRVLVRSFWLTLSAFAAVPWLVFGLWSHAPGLVAGSLVVAVLSGVTWFVREDFAWRVYGAWNRRLVRPFGSIAGRVVMAVCFFLVFFAARRVGPRSVLAKRSGSLTSWTGRQSLAPDVYTALFAAASPGSVPGAWIADYLRWARETENHWAVSLLPFLAVLRFLDLDEQKASQGNIYTLF